MHTLLVIHSSSRANRSITRRLADRYSAAWLQRHPEGKVLIRDVGTQPVPPTSEAWISAAFSDPAQHSAAMREALARSEELVEELFQASAIVVGAPMYNFGMPAQLKAWVDQIIRAGRTFAFNPDSEEDPYLPLIPPKPVILITSKGANGYEPGEPMAHLNFLEPHLEAIFRFIGMKEISVVRVGFEEFKDERFERSLSAAEIALDQLAAGKASLPANNFPEAPILA